MSRNLLSMAILAALAAPSVALADAEVKWYGKAHLDFGFVNEKPSGDSESYQQIRSNSSRFGAKGSVDINDSTKAIFQLEMGVKMDQKDVSIEGRSMWIGLKGNWGEFHMGRDDLPYKKATGNYDVMGDTYGDYNDIISKDEDKRQDNSLTYWFKTGGFTAAASYSVGSESDKNYGKILGAAVGFSTDMLHVTVAAQTTGESSDGADDSVTAIKAGVMGKFGAFSVGLVGEQVDNEQDDADETNVALVGTFKVSKAGTIKALYGVKQFEDDNLDDATKLSVMYDHKFNKNFSAYVVGATGQEDGLSAANKLDGEKASAIAIGGVYKF